VNTENQEEIKWRFNRKLGMIAWLLFILSFFVPAVSFPGGDSVYGWTLAEQVFSFRTWSRFSSEIYDFFKDPIALINNPSGLLAKMNGFQQHILIMANVFMVLSAFLVRVKTFRQRFWYPGILAVGFLVLMISVMLWIGIVLQYGLFGIKIFNWGYAMWSISFGLLALSIRENKVKQES
jgi:hypothetical protein